MAENKEKNIKNQKSLLFAILFVILLSASVYVLHIRAIAPTVNVQVGLVLPGSVEHSGWSKSHFKGISAAIPQMHATLSVMQDVKDNESCVSAMNQLYSAGCRIIFLAGKYYSKEIQDFILQKKDVSFFTTDYRLKAENLGNYSSRLYQAWFLSGVAAAGTVQGNNFGFVAFDNSVEVCRNVSAFTLGLRSVNPKAKVYFAQANDLLDIDSAKQALRVLVKEKGIDCAGFQMENTVLVETADALGLPIIAYEYENTAENKNIIATVSTDWSKIYKELLFLGVKRTISEQPFLWFGLEKDAVAVSGYSSIVPEKTRSAVNAVKEMLIAKHDVFSGILYSNTGSKICDKNESLSDFYLYESYDYLVEGIETYEIK